MGMRLSVASLSDATIQRLLNDPPLVWQVLSPDDPEPFERSLREAAERARPGFVARLFGARTRVEEPRRPEPLTLNDGEGELGDIDKSWHGIHYLLTCTADESAPPPLNFLLAGGKDVGDEDVGYGTARVYTAVQTRRIADAFAAVSDDELRRRFAPEAMMRAEIYPEIWDRDPADDDTLGYLMEYVGVLRDMLASATSRGHGLMVVLS
jgi:hypothetical protein